MAQPSEKKTGLMTSIGIVSIPISLLVIVFLLACAGYWVPIDFLFNLCLGWGLFLWKVIPQVVFSLPGITTFVVVLGLFTAGVHYAGGHWLRIKNQPHQPTNINDTVDIQPQDVVWKFKWTAQILFSLVLLFASGIAIVGVAHQGIWVATSQEKWTHYDGGGRTASRRNNCKNNLKQVGIALHIHHETYTMFPAGGTFDKTGRPMHSWATMLLPFIEKHYIYKEIDRSQPWDAPANAKPFQTVLEGLICPSTTHPVTNSKKQALSSFAANSKVFPINKQLKMKDITDGSSATIFAGEVNSRFKPWGDPTNVRDPAYAINRHRNGFGSQHSGGAHVLFGDGRVRFMSNDTNPDVLKALSTPNAKDYPGEY